MRVTEVNLIPGRGYQSEPQSICVDHHDRPDPELSNSETLSEGSTLPPHPRWPVGALAGPPCQVGSCELLPWQVTWWLRWVRWRGQVAQEFIPERCSQVSNICGVKKPASPSQDSGVCSMFVAALQLTLCHKNMWGRGLIEDYVFVVIPWTSASHIFLYRSYYELCCIQQDKYLEMACSEELADGVFHHSSCLMRHSTEKASAWYQIPP